MLYIKRVKKNVWLLLLHNIPLTGGREKNPLPCCGGRALVPSPSTPNPSFHGDFFVQFTSFGPYLRTCIHIKKQGGMILEQYYVQLSKLGKPHIIQILCPIYHIL